MLGVGALLTEVFLRIFDPVGISYFGEIKKYEELRVRGTPYDYITEPGYRGRLQDVDVVINRRGLRTPEFAGVKPSGTRRMLILGDSIVFGWGVAQNDIVSAQLQRLADERSSENWEMIGAGAMSWNARTEYEFLIEEDDSIDADVMVVIFTPNDAIPHDQGRTSVALDSLMAEMDRNESRRPPSAVRAVVERSYLLTTVHFLSRTRLLAHERPQLFCEETSAAARDAARAVESIVAHAREEGALLMVYLDQEPDSKCAHLFEGALARHGVPVRRFPAALDQRENRNSAVDPHPNAKGHRLMAEQIWNDLAAELKN